MVLQGAIGDAYGAAFELVDHAVIKEKNTLRQYEYHPLYKDMYRRYTDDTQMAIAIAELLIEGQEWTAVNIADKFVKVFKRDVHTGYSRGFFHLLCDSESGEDLLKQLIPKSERNGAAMRAYPLGILNSEAEVLRKTAIQASVTHNTEKGVLSAQAVALMSHYFIYQKGKKADLQDYLWTYQQHLWPTDWQDWVRVDGMQTVAAVLTLLTHKQDLKSILKQSVDFGGDTDTVASIALAIGSLSQEVEQNLPEFLYRDIENDTYGRDYIEQLDKELVNLVP